MSSTGSPADRWSRRKPNDDDDDDQYLDTNNGDSAAAADANEKQEQTITFVPVKQTTGGPLAYADDEAVAEEQKQSTVQTEPTTTANNKNAQEKQKRAWQERTSRYNGNNNNRRQSGWGNRPYTSWQNNNSNNNNNYQHRNDGAQDRADYRDAPRSSNERPVAPFRPPNDNNVAYEGYGTKRGHQSSAPVSSVPPTTLRRSAEDNDLMQIPAIEMRLELIRKHAALDPIHALSYRYACDVLTQLAPYNSEVGRCMAFLEKLAEAITCTQQAKEFGAFMVERDAGGGKKQKT